MLVCFYGLIPLLQSAGLADFPAYLLGMGLPLGLLLAAALWLVHQEGHPLSWSAFAARLRLGRMNSRDWRTLLAVLAWSVGTNVLIGGLMMLAKVYDWLPLPGNLLAIQDPRILPTSQILHAAWGGDIRGQWGIVILVAVWLFVFNILGEELWWRGYLLPRQELASGSRAWVIQGVYWTLFHAFKYWAMPALLPVCLALAFMAQRTKNTTPVILAHFLINGSMLILIVMAVLGL